MSTEMAQRTPADGLVEKIRSDDFRAQIAQALPDGVTVDRFTRATVTALLQNPDIAGVQDKNSLFQAIIRCAQDGLMPDGKQAALVIYGTKIQYLPMIGGVRKIAAEYGWTIKTHVVYANDSFDVDQGTDIVTHRPAPLGVDRGEGIGAWAVAHHRDGRRPITEVMDKAEIMKRRAVAKTKNVWDGPFWATMWEKTLGHRIAKKLPLDPVDAERLSRVIAAAERDPGDSAALLYGPDARPLVAHELPPVEGMISVPPTDPEVVVEAGAAVGVTAAPADDEAPGPAEPVGVDPTLETLAIAAALHDPKQKAWPGMTLGQIFEHPDGEAFLGWCLDGRCKQPATVQAATDFARVYAPEVYHEALAKKDLAA